METEGSFLGHIIPGVILTALGVWWTLCIFKEYFESLTKRAKPFKSQVTFFPMVTGRKFDLEAAFLTLQLLVGFAIEVLYPSMTTDIPLAGKHIQHATIYFFFGLCGLVCLVKPFLNKVGTNADNVAYISLLMAYSTQAILLMFHLMGRDMLDSTVHTLFLYSVYGCILMTLAEMSFRHQVLAALGRAFFMTLQGTWISQGAAVLFRVTLTVSMDSNPAWDHFDHENVMYATCIFTWHIGSVFLFMLLCGVGWAWVYRRRGELYKNTNTIADEENQLINDDDD